MLELDDRPHLEAVDVVAHLACDTPAAFVKVVCLGETLNGYQFAQTGSGHKRKATK